MYRGEDALALLGIEWHWFVLIASARVVENHGWLPRPYNVHDFYKKTGIVQRIAKHPIFDGLTLMVISCNAVRCLCMGEFREDTTNGKRFKRIVSWARMVYDTRLAFIPRKQHLPFFGNQIPKRTILKRLFLCLTDTMFVCDVFIFGTLSIVYKIVL